MKKYFVDGAEFDNVFDAVDEIMSCIDTDEKFEEWIAREYDDVEVLGNYYNAVDVLRAMGDYDDAMDTFLDPLREEIELKVGRLEVGEERDIEGCNVECTDADAELISEALADLSAVREWVENAPKLYAHNPPIDRIESLKSFIGAMAERMKEE